MLALGNYLLHRVSVLWINYNGKRTAYTKVVYREVTKCMAFQRNVPFMFFMRPACFANSVPYEF
jgi:hypothetical protein